MDYFQFELKVGRAPEDDDLARVNCPRAGSVGHFNCGWCETHKCPRFECGCREVLDHDR